MARSQEPLLARRPSSENNRDIAEEDALLTGQQSEKYTRRRKWKETGITIWALLATIGVIVLGVLFGQTHNSRPAPPSPDINGKRNLIFMVSDGMGPTSLALTRSYRQAVGGLPYDDTLFLDSYEIGKSRTRSTSSLITDSAAGATAFSCGRKSYNGAISVLPDHSPCGTVLEAAKRAGYMTGLVVTTRITDATPACFAAHVNMRSEEDRIAEQMLGDYPLGRTVDLMLGAGRCHFLPNTTAGSCRSDTKDMVARAKSVGFNYVGNRQEFDGLGTIAKLPLLGLFADGDIPYEIDRQYEEDVYPSLKEMAELAMNTLREATRDRDKGFFLMVEGSRIDHAGHANDPAAQVHEVLAYDRAFQAVIEFLDNDETQGVMVATSDHETGGLSTGRQLDPYQYPSYRWFPSVLANASHSVSWMASKYARYLQDKQTDPSHADPDADAAVSGELNTRDASKFLRNAIQENMGIYDIADAELEPLLDKPLAFASWIFADMISRRAQTGWATHGHSGADVNIYASDGKVAKALTGNHENTEVGDFLKDYLGVDVDAVTEELKKKGSSWDEKNVGVESWMGRRPFDGENMDGGSHLERYQGDFKMKRHMR